MGSFHLVACKLSFCRLLVLIKGGVEIRKSRLARLTNFLELLYMTSCCGEINLRYLESGPSGVRQLAVDEKKTIIETGALLLLPQVVVRD